MLIIVENFKKMIFEKAKLVKNIKKCWNLRILTKMLNCWKMLIWKLIYLPQLIFLKRSLKDYYYPLFLPTFILYS